VRLLLVRHAYLDTCTLGTLYVDDLKLATLEEPWIRNPAGPGGQPMISCIPDGSYVVMPHVSGRYPDGVFVFSNPTLGVHAQVKPKDQPYGRVAILIHPGNDLEDTEGCVLVGMRHVGNTVEQSRMAMARLKEKLIPNEPHDIHIRPTAGTSEL
jgi:hypothetical protein